ncbi:MAG: class I fructose-bisphosphate aldolase [bacterium]|nr:class I fructose-bisphosphate aldolase [bacterium]
MKTLQSLEKTVHALIAEGKGILAADESAGTCDKRFDAYGIPKTPEMRRKWRQLLFSTSGIQNGLSGVILYDETIKQKADDGTPFPKLLQGRGIIPGIKVDGGTVPWEGSLSEKITNGLDGLLGRLAEYHTLGARFAKWRAVITIGEGLPTEGCIRENAIRLAMYARACQVADIVPILEPEVLLDGTHTLARSKEVLTQTLEIVFEEVQKYGAHLEGLLLKSSMALPGKESGLTASPEEVATATLDAFTASVPASVPGIVFLSGGQTPEEATIRLNTIVQMAKAQKAPWVTTFSYSRALQAPVLEYWKGQEANASGAQAIFEKRVKESSLASKGEFK